MYLCNELRNDGQQIATPPKQLFGQAERNDQV